MTSTILLIGATLALIVWASVFGGKLPVPFGARSCQGTSWRRSFPDAPKEEIRKFLSLFTDSFAFDNTERLKLNPDDQLLDIYRALYPRKWQADALEFETLAHALESEYKVKLASVWHNGLTLGQLFAHVRRAPEWRLTTGRK
jgi:propanediol dehydratase small subunit